MTMAMSRGAGLLVVTFLVGVLAGVALDRSRANHAPTGTRVMSQPRQVLDQLGLTPEQRRAADSIFERSSPRSEAAMRELVPRLAAIADSVNMELGRILTPAQRRRLDSLTGGPMFILKRKDSSGTTRVDTIGKRN